jgi:F5/8 type C domain
MNRSSVVAGGLFSCILACGIHAANPYKNCALNPNDVQDAGWTLSKGYPHATSNSEYPAPLSQPPDPEYTANNAIDGNTANTVETRDPSWGPNKVPNIWWKVTFGKTVQIDSVVIWIRADWATSATTPISHDSYWKSGTLVFSDSSKVNITIDSTAKSQGYKFPAKRTTMLMLTNLVAKADRWCALAELQAWGYENPTEVNFAPAPARLPMAVPANGVCFLSGIPVQDMAVPSWARGVAIYTILGQKVWAAALENGNGANSIVSIPRTLAKGIYRFGFSR